MRLAATDTNRGISLLDMLAALAVIGAVVAMAAPSFRGYVADRDLSNTTNLFISHLNAARSEAVNRGVPVALCVSTDAATCSDATTWEHGWLVFTDADGAPGRIDGSDEILLIGEDQDNRVEFETESSYVRFGTIGQIDPY